MAARRLEPPHQQVEQGALARAHPAQEGDGFAWGDRATTPPGVAGWAASAVAEVEVERISSFALDAAPRVQLGRVFRQVVAGFGDSVSSTSNRRSAEALPR